jgi:hypothetical protein
MVYGQIIHPRQIEWDTVLGLLTNKGLPLTIHPIKHANSTLLQKHPGYV